MVKEVRLGRWGFFAIINTLIIALMYKVVGFDLFGTLMTLDDAVALGKVVKETFDQHEIEVFTKHWLRWHRQNDTLDSFMHDINQELDFKLDEAKLSLIERRATVKNTQLYADVLPTLERLKTNNYQIVLLSNSTPPAKGIFENEKDLAKYFSQSFWSFENGFMKPEPEAFDNMIQNLNINKEELLYVGDNVIQDYQGAKDCGIKALLLDRLNKYPEISDRINSLSELNI
jgi:HAD superfamily hydrolase (TIGR01662 family)